MLWFFMINNTFNVVVVVMIMELTATDNYIDQKPK